MRALFLVLLMLVAASPCCGYNIPLPYQITNYETCTIGGWQFTPYLYVSESVYETVTAYSLADLYEKLSWNEVVLTQYYWEDETGAGWDTTVNYARVFDLAVSSSTGWPLQVGIWKVNVYQASQIATYTGLDGRVPYDQWVNSLPPEMNFNPAPPADEDNMTADQVTQLQQPVMTLIGAVIALIVATTWKG